MQLGVNLMLKPVMTWIDERFPMSKMVREHLTEYYAPKNFNFWYFFGGLAIVVLAIQILSGIFLTMHYKPDAEKAFASVEYIMRDVPFGVVDPLRAFDRRVHVLCGDLFAYV
jgi:ubiquinol-cytochrome c reductase cytochrome b subunit